ncbi:MAG: CapA family protein [Anaerolineales bacterium]|nr:CapA family protein [Anaerolineales bacterium]
MAAVDLGDAPVALLAESERAGVKNKISVTTTASSDPAVVLSLKPSDGDPLYQYTFVAATRFDTVSPQITLANLRRSWSTTTPTYTQVVVLSDTLPALVQVLGNAGRAVRGHATLTDVVDAAWQDRTTLALVPFDQLNPRLVVLAVDGQNPVENANYFDPARYPLVATIYGNVAGRGAMQNELGAQLMAALPTGNRDPDKLTVLAMTGVTAMTRQMAVQMDRFGAGWPAAVVGPELASADITAVSNEVPFVEGCVPNIDPENFNFCSKPEYMQALTDAGVDIIGLTGNHQNDFGRENARKSIALHEDAGLPLYGGGLNLEAAFKPLILEHNGNRLAFLGANSYGPKMAWATDSEPGSAPFDLNIMSATIPKPEGEGAGGCRAGGTPVSGELRHYATGRPTPGF